MRLDVSDALPNENTADESRSKWSIAWLGFLLGPLACIAAIWLLPSHYNLPGDPASPDAVSLAEFSFAGRATLAVMIWMGIWWLSEPVDISITALLPLAVFPLLGVATMAETAFPYADPLVFLYFGGFIIALSMERWGLGKRIALLTLGFMSTSASSMVAGFMLATAALSAFVSNTATTAMMLPIALSVIALLGGRTSQGSGPSDKAMAVFAPCLLLSIAYSASIGGVMTIVGTPTNAFLVGFVRDRIATEFQQDIGFADWLPIGVSVSVVFLPIMFYLMTRWIFPIARVEFPGGRAIVKQELRMLGSVGRGELNTLVVFCVTVVLWLCRPWLNKLSWKVDGLDWSPLASVTDTGIAMSAAMALFLLPVSLSRREFTMDWTTTKRMPWGILYLFGGGLTLAAAIQANQVAEFIGSQVTAFGQPPAWILVLLVTAGIVFLTELTSNAATTASLVPVLAAIAPGLGVHPYLLIFPATIAASCAFMLPVATPPNAIVFGSGRIASSQMIRAGFVLNLAAIVIVSLLAMLVIKPWLGV